MKIDEQLISRLEHLARLELSDVEKANVMRDLDNILALIEKMNELDTQGVEPLVYINPIQNSLREDRIENQVSREEALQNAPKQDGVYFRVPKVIDLK